MKRYCFILTVCLVCAVLLCSCSGIDVPVSSGRGWTQRDFIPKGIMRIGTIRADKSSDWNSLEREIGGLLPLLLLDRGYMLVEENAENLPAAENLPGKGMLRIDAMVVEREYLSGWNTKRSLSAEIRIWGNDSALPLAAGRAVLSGDQSFASSKVLTKLLQLALSKALAGLENPPPRPVKPGRT